MAETIPSVTQPSELARRIAEEVVGANPLPEAYETLDEMWRVRERHVKNMVALIAEQIAATERDAERYRWLRRTTTGIRDDEHAARESVDSPEQFDAAVDLAMSKEQ